MTETVAIEMVSDIVCPWCWLGLRRLRAAIDQVPEVNVELYLRPYQLDPTLPEDGMKYKSYMKQKFGSEAFDGADHAQSKNKWKQMRAALEEYGAAEGIPFNFDDIPMRPNTTNAHRLVHWAQGQGKGLEMKEALFTAFFTDHRDVGDKAVLADIAEEVGLDRGIIEDLLKGDADRDTVARETNMFMQMGVRGVPCFVGNRAIAVQGAQDVETLTKLIRKTAEMRPEDAARFGMT